MCDKCYRCFFLQNSITRKARQGILFKMLPIFKTNKSQIRRFHLIIEKDGGKGSSFNKDRQWRKNHFLIFMLEIA